MSEELIEEIPAEESVEEIAGEYPEIAHRYKAGEELTDEELVNAIRQDIIGELEAIHEYDAHVQATDNEDAKKVLSDIRDEEREHMGELLELLERLAPDEKALHDEGRGEVREMLDK